MADFEGMQHELPNGRNIGMGFNKGNGDYVIQLSRPLGDGDDVGYLRDQTVKVVDGNLVTTLFLKPDTMAAWMNLALRVWEVPEDIK